MTLLVERTIVRPFSGVCSNWFLKPAGCGGSVYGDRINAVDMRFAKVLRFGRYRTNVGMDLYNLFNSNTPTTYETVYDPATNGAKWMQPTAVLLPRFMRFNVQVDF